MASDCKTLEASDLKGFKDVKNSAKKSMIDIIRGKLNENTDLIRQFSQQNNAQQEAMLKFAASKSEGYALGVTPSVSDCWSDSTNATIKCSETIFSNDGERPTLQDFSYKSDSTIGNFSIDSNLSMYQTPTKPQYGTHYDQNYEQADIFLDAQGHRFIMPADETKQRKSVRMSENAKIDISYTSPTLSKVCSSSLLARRQNSPQLGSSPMVSRFGALQKSQSLPMKASSF